MITTRNREYKQTKRIKQGKAILKAPFDELARWIASSWNVTVPNVIYDRRNSYHAPRLQIIVEEQSESFNASPYNPCDPEKQRAIKNEFLEIIGRENTHNFEVDGLFVVVFEFAPLARQEADSRITESEIDALKRRIDNPDLWGISRICSRVTFFFFTDAQVKRHEAEGKKVQYAKMYFALLKPHDEFGYLHEKEFVVAFDSKQNFDENFHSSWFYYYK